MMAILIDSLAQLDNQTRRKFKKVFEQLSDEYVIRTPTGNDKIADLIVEGPGYSWLVIGCHRDIPNTNELKKYVAFTAAMRTDIKYLAVTDTKESMLDALEEKIHGVVRIERSDFFESGTDMIHRLMASVHDDIHQIIKAQWVPESQVINSSRRVQQIRNNGAQLQGFFLDYNQEMAVKLDMLDSIPVDGDEPVEADFSIRLINGVAGSGKTLILINRALLYCQFFPEKKALLLIHNKPIKRDISSRIEQSLGALPPNLKIQTFHGFALSQQRNVFGHTKPLFRNIRSLKVKIQTAINKLQLNTTGLSLDQIWSEIEHINDYMIRDKSTYLDADRQGRGFSLNNAQRESVWRLYEEAVNLFSSQKNGFLPSLYIKNLCLREDIDELLDTFDHIMIDEAQFFSPSWLQLTKKSMNPGGMLFLSADPRQGFLKHRVSWHSVGLAVRGRTKTLKHSYRTTYEIMIAANAVVERLDESPDDFVKPDLEKMTHGALPRIIYCESPQDELVRVVNELLDVVTQRIVPFNQIMILCGDGIDPQRLQDVVEARLGQHTIFNCNDDGYWITDRIKLLTINSCTGMESAVVFVVGAGDLLATTTNIEHSTEERGRLQDELARKLYVAMTRAGQKLVLVSTEKLPAHVEQYFEVVA